jgi:hypothetical protein
MDQFALGAQIIEGAKEVLEAALEENVGEAPRGVSLKQVLPTVPHGRLNKALVFLAGAVDGKRLQGSSQVPMAGMGRVGLIDGLVSPELVSTCLPVVTGEELQGDIVMLPASSR